MTPFRFIHTSDLHLDSPFRGLTEIAPALKDTLFEATFLAFQNIVDLCIEKEVDGLLIAGDLHDAVNRSLRSLTRLRDQFLRLQDHHIQVLICHGNHDPLTAWEKKFHWPDNVHVFGTETVESHPLFHGNTHVADIYGISYGVEQVTENLAKGFRNKDSSVWSIGLLHTNVGGDKNHLNYAPCELQDLLDARMNYWALGHIHAHRVLHTENPLIIYPGNPQGRHPRETGARGCYLIEVNHQGTPAFEFLPVDIIRWHQESVSIENISTLDDLLTVMETRGQELLQGSGNRPGIVRWKLIGRGPLNRDLSQIGQREDLLTTLRDRMGLGAVPLWSESIHDSTGREVDVEALRKEENLLGDFLRLSAESDNQMIDELRHSLKILLEDSRLRKYLKPPQEEGLRQLIQAAEREGIDRLLIDEN